MSNNSLPTGRLLVFSTALAVTAYLAAPAVTRGLDGSFAVGQAFAQESGGGHSGGGGAGETGGGHSGGQGGQGQGGHGQGGGQHGQGQGGQGGGQHAGGKGPDPNCAYQDGSGRGKNTGGGISEAGATSQADTGAVGGGAGGEGFVCDGPGSWHSGNKVLKR